MGKRSAGQFDRSPRDFYRTVDPRAVAALNPYLDAGTKFVEPCAGAGDLVRDLAGLGHECVFAGDIEPQKGEGLFGTSIMRADAFNFERCPGVGYNDYRIITNPPWQRAQLHALIPHMIQQHPTWLLFDADWPHTIQDDVAKEYGVPTTPELMAHCKIVICVGRLKWFNDQAGKDNSAWYLFDRDIHPYAQFYGKEP